MARSNFDSSNSEEFSSGIRGLVVSVELADLLGLSVILAAAFSAYSTWRTAELANVLLLITPWAMREYISIARIPMNPVWLRTCATADRYRPRTTTIDGKLPFSRQQVSGKRRPVFYDLCRCRLAERTARYVLYLPADTYRKAIAGKGRCN